jgi:uncharacterized membrane protein YedE/YeeE
MQNFTPFSSLLGGVLIGLSATAMLIVNGRIAGISGILAGVLRPRPGETSWRALFLAGLLVGGALAGWIAPGSIGATPRPFAIAVVAGLLVGVGTAMGNGCTSGHGVCGISRWSTRSIVATATFMLTGVVTAVLARHV